ncbi:MAG: DmsE family decaheme c-type cytochrome [Rhodanobacter sp.]|nr:MAG: DmsE family decaheme c-type cytochrome [Rhodanobacter sp.]
MYFLKRLAVGAVLILASWVAPALAGSPPIQLPDLGTNHSTSVQTSAATAADALAQDAKCTRCHDENEQMPILSIYQTPHGVKGDLRTPTCQSCHGPSENHLAGDKTGKGIPPPDVMFNKHDYPMSDAGDRAAVCLTCHKGTQRSHWDGSEHQTNGLACNDCHKVHSAVDPVRSKLTQPEVCGTCHKDRRADIHKISHHPIGEGKVTCSDCHNPHGSTGPHLLKKTTVTETCTTCHAEKRGPFLWEHQPVVEDCTNCHTPHGSNIPPLLKSRAPFLCDECHDGPHNSQRPYGAGAAGLQSTLSGFAVSGGRAPNPSSSASGRACLNCHVMIHGSNSPAGAFLHR